MLDSQVVVHGLEEYGLSLSKVDEHHTYGASINSYDVFNELAEFVAILQRNL